MECWQADALHEHNGDKTVSEELDVAVKAAVDEILEDMTDRSGFRQIWDGIDEGIQADIKRAWFDIVRLHMEQFA